MAMTHVNRANAFWAETSTCEHFVQIYESEEVFMDILASFVSEALKENHAAVVSATPAHRQELNKRLTKSGHDLAAFRLQDQLICLDAEEMTRKFMANGRADDGLFFQLVADILARATKNGRKPKRSGKW
jgi:MEDS: MEthanogen/methylotroph, DcmR Sensory domain